ncbi:hypothetical protein [Desulfomonile tiedjei]|nr:hypothetical protein [Desulfomonile tiedjei]
MGQKVSPGLVRRGEIWHIKKKQSVEKEFKKALERAYSLKRKDT